MSLDRIRELTATRRALLKRGALLLAGAVGLEGVSRASGPAAGRSPVGMPSTAPLRAERTVLHGRSWHCCSQEGRAGLAPRRGDRLLTYGELTSERGDTVGEFYGVDYAAHAPLGVSPLAAASMEIHTLRLTDGTLVGIGTTPPQGMGPGAFAIVGGTGRYTGATGSYVAVQRPTEFGGDGTAEFTLTLSAESPAADQLGA